MPTFLSDPRVLPGPEADRLEAGRGVALKVGAFKPAAFVLASVNAAQEVAALPTGTTIPSRLVLPLEPADDPYYEAAFSDDRIKPTINALELRRGDRIWIQARGAALAATHIGSLFRPTADGTGLDLTASSNGYLRIVAVVPWHQPYMQAGKIHWATPAVGDTNVYVEAIVEV